MSRARRAAPVTAVAVALIAALGLGAGGCKKHDAKPATRPEPISAAERKRGDDACNAYLARLCACAATRPEMASRCELKQAKKEAIEMLLRIDDAGRYHADVGQPTPGRAFHIWTQVLLGGVWVDAETVHPSIGFGQSPVDAIRRGLTIR